MNLAVCMICRDVEFFLPLIFKNIEKLSHYNLHLIFIYDNCIDKTGELLKMYKEKSNFNIYIKELTNNNSKCRTVRIANARNECLKILYTLDNIQYHIVLDSDNVNCVSWDNSHLIDYYINEDKSWDCITFNRKIYYDTWALMIDDFKWHVWGWGVFSKYIVKIIRLYIEEKLKISKEDIECHSAFNGFAIYRTQKYKNIKYIGWFKDIPKNFFKKEDINKSISFINKISNINEYITIDSKKLINNWFVDNEKLINIHQGEICEHIYYNLSAKKLNNCVIKISTKCLQSIDD
jgi:hypothetical protein